MRVNIIGAGNLGKTLGYLLAKKAKVEIGAICNRSRASTEAAINFIGAGTLCESIALLPEADLTFIATADDDIAYAASLLLSSAALKSSSFVVHCSGLHSSDTLSALKAKGLRVASIHPMKSFANPEIAVKTFEGTYCAMEGDKEALLMLAPLFKAMGSFLYEIKKENKASYHAAGVFASNYLLTLLQASLTCMKDAGVEEASAFKAMSTIMKGTLFNVEQSLNPKTSLTGPIRRGDEKTIKAHMASFKSPQLKALYSLLGQMTIDLTDFDEQKRNALERAVQIQDKR